MTWPSLALLAVLVLAAACYLAIDWHRRTTSTSSAPERITKASIHRESLDLWEQVAAEAAKAAPLPIDTWGGWHRLGGHGVPRWGRLDPDGGYRLPSGAQCPQCSPGRCTPDTHRIPGSEGLIDGTHGPATMRQFQKALGQQERELRELQSQGTDTEAILRASRRYKELRDVIYPPPIHPTRTITHQEGN